MADKHKGLVVSTDPKSAVSEAIRCLRTNIQFLNVGKKSQVVVITSSAPQEGKTFVAANLAIVTAQANKKTLLIDADMRRPHLHKIFGIGGGKEGLSTALSGEMSSLKEVPFLDTMIENLTLLTSGMVPPNPAELLEGGTFNKLLSMAREEFDIIYVDTPPLLSVTDPIIVSKRADGTILIVMADVTPQKIATRSYSLLKEAGVHVIGTVLNRVDTGPGGYYRYRYYYKRYYGSYYGSNPR